MDTDTLVYGVVGNPVKHSLSPYMHNLAFKLCSFNGAYLAFDVSNIGGCIEGVRSLGISGLSVTIPHKESIIKFLDEVSESALKIGAVNTVINENGVLKGDNTDWVGVVNSIKDNTEIKDKKVLVIGAGGASRGVCYGIINERANLFITNRTREKGELLAKEFNAKFVDEKELLNLKPEIIINTTSVGMYPNIDKSPLNKRIFKGAELALDIVYNPIETKFLKDAKSFGLKTVSGVGMFVYQGQAQFNKWTGKSFPIQIMKEKIFNKLITK